jgi:hypothetical protein
MIAILAGLSLVALGLAAMMTPAQPTEEERVMTVYIPRGTAHQPHRFGE